MLDGRCTSFGGITMHAHRTGVLTGAVGGAVVSFLITSAFAAPPERLAPEAIQSTFFNGQPFTATTNSNVKFKMTFTPDGKMARVPAGGRGSKGEGTWKLSKDGFCTAWKGAGGNCFTVVRAGENKWSVLKGSTIMAAWSK